MRARDAVRYARSGVGCLLIAVGLLSGWLAVPVAAQTTETITIETDVAPRQQDGTGAAHRVTLELSGVAACPVEAVAAPTDVVIAFERTVPNRSLGGDLELLREAARAFVASTERGRERVGIVAFDALAYTVVAPTEDRNALETGIAALEPGAGIALGPAIEHSVRQLQLAGDAGGAARQALIVVNSTPDPSDASQQAALAARLQGVRIIAVGVGDQVGREDLVGIASSSGDVVVVPDVGQLETVLGGLIDSVRQPAPARDVEIAQTFDPAAVEIDPATIIGPGRIEGDQVIWSIPAVYENPVQVGYDARPLTAGTLTVDRGTAVRYRACERALVETSLPATLRINGVVPTQVPVVLTPTVLAEVPDVLQVAAIPDGVTDAESPWELAWAQICRSIETIGWILWVIALLLTLWILYRFIQDQRDGLTPNRPEPCRWILRLLWPLFIAFLAHLIPILLSGACRSGEVVYFWRIGGMMDYSGGIFVTDGRGWRPAEELVVTSEGSCVGCHAVSANSGRLAAVVGSGTGQISARQLDGTTIALPEVIGSYSAWSPDGTRLVISTDAQQLVIVDTIAGTVTPLSGASDPEVAQIMPSWSPDGRTIAFVRGERSGVSFRLEGRSDIYTIPVTGGTAQPLAGASGQGMNYYPSYSPDGKWLAFTYHDAGGSTYADPDAQIYLVPAAGGERRRLAANDGPNGERLGAASNSWPTWSRDGRSLAFTSKRDDPSYDIYVTRIDDAGNSGIARPLPGAAQPGVFEHTPFWGTAPIVDLWPSIIGLWPFLLGILFILLMWWLCMRRRDMIIVPPPAPPQGPLRTPEPRRLPRLFDAEPAVIIGVGLSGRWIATHLKKTMRDSGGGELPAGVRFLVIDTPQPGGQQDRVRVAGVELEETEIVTMDRGLAQQLTLRAVADDECRRGWVPQSYAGLPVGQMTLQQGTNGRRPFARAGFIDLLRDTAQAEALVQQLQDAIESAERASAEHAERTNAANYLPYVRIIIVGSIAGGTSGIIADLAYLAKKYANAYLTARVVHNNFVGIEDRIYLDGYFTSDSAYPADQNRQVNAAATLREIERFQLYSNVEKRFQYNALAHGEPLDGELKQMLFDNVALFGGVDGVNPPPPQRSLYVSIADAITFTLERTVAAAAQQQRVQARNDVVLAQQQERQLVVRSAGTYNYRLPLIDILEIVRAHLSSVFVETYFGAPAPLDEHERNEAGQLATNIVRAIHPVFGVLSQQRFVQARHVAEFVAVSREDCLARINEWLAGRLTRAQRLPIMLIAETLNRTITLLNAIRADAQQQRDAAPAATRRNLLRALWLWLGFGRANQDEWDALLRSTDVCIDVIGEVQRSWDALRQVIHGDQQLGLIGVRARVSNTLAEAQQRRTELDAITVRRYLWQVQQAGVAGNLPATIDLVTHWSREAEQDLRRMIEAILVNFTVNDAQGQPTPLYTRFILNRESGEHPVLVADAALLPHDQRLRELSMVGDGILEIIDEVAHLASRDLAVAAAQAGNVDEYIYTIADGLASVYDPNQPNPANTMIAQMWPTLQPHLDPARGPGYQPTHTLAGFAGLPAAVEQDARHAQLLRVLRTMGTIDAVIQVNPQVSVKDYATTDRSALSLLVEYNRGPMNQITTVQHAFTAYRNSSAAQPVAGVAPTTERAVHLAEATALEYERRRHNQQLFPGIQYRRLHPLFVTALEQPDLVRTYALAFAAGWLNPNQANATIQLNVPGHAVIELRSHDNLPADACDLHVSALLQLKQEAHLLDAAAHALRDQERELLDTLWQQFVVRFNPNQVVVWNQQHPHAPLRPHDYRRQELLDLAIVAALEIRRIQAPDAWDNLITP